MIKALLLVFLLCLPALAQVKGGNKPMKGREGAADGIDERQAYQMLRVISESTGPFMGSDEARSLRGSLDHFFGFREYSVLKGNPVLGYCCRQGLKWDGKRLAVNVKSMGHNADALAITPKAWEIAFQAAAKAHKVILDDNAPVKLEGACVMAALRPSDGNPRAGVLLEIRATDKQGGQFLWRFNLGKDAGIEAAVLGAADWIMAVLREAGK